VILVTSFGRSRTYLYQQQDLALIGDWEAVMLVRKLAAASVELLVMAVGAAIAAPYVLVLVSPFILGR